jgi:serine/threonine protein kinase
MSRVRGIGQPTKHVAGRAAATSRMNPALRLFCSRLQPVTNRGPLLNRPYVMARIRCPCARAAPVSAHYEVVSPLGAGGIGEVYRARPVPGTPGRHQDAPAHFLADLERLARFVREAQLLVSLNHPNVASIHGLINGGDRQTRPGSPHGAAEDVMYAGGRELCAPQNGMYAAQNVRSPGVIPSAQSARWCAP